MILRLHACAAAAVVLAVFTSATSAAEPGRAETEAIVRDYLAKNPEELQRLIEETLLSKPDIITRAINEAVKRQREAKQAAPERSEAVRLNAEALFRSTHQVTLGNPNGDITLVEFFDYNCGYCKRAMSDKLALIASDPKLKVVLKELPVLGQGSVEAAKVAVAVRMQDQTGKVYLDFHQKLLGQRRADREAALAVARELPLDMKRLELDMESGEVLLTLEESTRLARALGITGTPSYVVGERVVRGAVGLDALNGHLLNARK